MAVDMINQGISKTTTVNNNATATPKADEKKPVSKTVIGASLVGLAALASVGIYLATRGKVKKVNPEMKNIQERILKDGNKVTKEVVNTENGKKTIMTVLDKEGNILLQKEKEIIHSINKSNGNKYISKIEKYLSSDKENITQINKGDEVLYFLGDGKIVTNKYYNNVGEKLLETEHQNLSMFRGLSHNQKTRITYKDGIATNMSTTNYGKCGGVESENIRGLRTRVTLSNGKYAGSDKTKFNNTGVK